MKHLLPLFLVFCTTAFAQRNKDTVTLAFNDQLISTNTERAEFTGYAVRTNNGWAAVIFDLQMRVIARGSYNARNCKSKEGWFTFYYPDGKRAANGQYHNDKRTGIWRTWYPSGKLQDSLEYQKDKPEGMYYAYHESGKISGFGKYKDGIEDSTWTWYHHNGVISSVEEFYKGKLEGQRCMDTTGKIQLKNCELYREPVTKDNKDLWQLVYRDTLLPRDELGRIVDGLVTIDIHITEKGEVKQLEVVPTGYPRLDSAISNILREEKEWYPAYNHNRPISYVRSVTVPFGKKRFNGEAAYRRRTVLPNRDQPPPPQGYYWNVDRDGNFRHD